MSRRQEKLDARREYKRQFKRPGKKHSARRSSTAGATKGIRASGLQRTFCARNRSYKHPLYVSVMKSLGNRGAAK